MYCKNSKNSLKYVRMDNRSKIIFGHWNINSVRNWFDLFR